MKYWISRLNRSFYRVDELNTALHYRRGQSAALSCISVRFPQYAEMVEIGDTVFQMVPGRNEFVGAWRVIEKPSLRTPMHHERYLDESEFASEVLLRAIIAPVLIGCELRLRSLRQSFPDVYGDFLVEKEAGVINRCPDEIGSDLMTQIRNSTNTSFSWRGNAPHICAANAASDTARVLSGRETLDFIVGEREPDRSIVTGHGEQRVSTETPEQRDARRRAERDQRVREETSGLMARLRAAGAIPAGSPVGVDEDGEAFVEFPDGSGLERLQDDIDDNIVVFDINGNNSSVRRIHSRGVIVGVVNGQYLIAGSDRNGSYVSYPVTDCSRAASTLIELGLDVLINSREIPEEVAREMDRITAVRFASIPSGDMLGIQDHRGDWHSMNMIVSHFRVEPSPFDFSTFNISGQDTEGRIVAMPRVNANEASRIIDILGYTNFSFIPQAITDIGISCYGWGFNRPVNRPIPAAPAPSTVVLDDAEEYDEDDSWLNEEEEYDDGDDGDDDETDEDEDLDDDE